MSPKLSKSELKNDFTMPSSKLKKRRPNGGVGGGGQLIFKNNMFPTSYDHDSKCAVFP